MGYFDSLPHGSIVHVHPSLLVKAKKKYNISTVKIKTAISTFGLIK